VLEAKPDHRRRLPCAHRAAVRRPRARQAEAEALRCRARSRLDPAPSSSTAALHMGRSTSHNRYYRRFGPCSSDAPSPTTPSPRASSGLPSQPAEPATARRRVAVDLVEGPAGAVRGSRGRRAPPTGRGAGAAPPAGRGAGAAPPAGRGAGGRRACSASTSCCSAGAAELRLDQVEGPAHRLAARGERAAPAPSAGRGAGGRRRAPAPRGRCAPRAHACGPEARSAGLRGHQHTLDRAAALLRPAAPCRRARSPGV